MNQLLHRYGENFSDFLQSYTRSRNGNTHHKFVFPNKYTIYVDYTGDEFLVKIRKKRKTEIISFNSDKEVEHCLVEVFVR